MVPRLWNQPQALATFQKFPFSSRARRTNYATADLTENTTDDETSDNMTVIKKHAFHGQKDLKKVFPSRNQFVFQNGIIIDSNFDSGNLMKCEQIESDDSVLVYDAQVCPDGYPYLVFQADDGREPGLFFSVSGLRPTQKRIRFNFRNLSN